MKEHLIQKNVAAHIADELILSVQQNLIGKQLSSFSSVTKCVKTAMQEAIVRILSPPGATNILDDVAQSKRRREPYVMAFVGVNGVGKSTNLSKICYWLLANGHNVLITAGDTFRSGAVEQLKTHIRNLTGLCKLEQKLELFERGYGRDAAAIAKDSIKYGKASPHKTSLI